jgi:predicted RNA-binding Zn-ribbon protein involved in translation (DUF1610 family)
MKKLFLIVTLLVSLTSCKSCTSTYASRKAGVQKVCPKCIYINSERMNIAIDTTQQPNIVYQVYFKSGGIYYTASDVEELVKIQ